jgi:catechol 2,3-dioxygenase-like lactoylglutathione lyase family enzyme
VFAQIRHVAITSPNYPLLGKFYEAMFGMNSSGRTPPVGYVAYSDGYVGLNLNPKRDGYIGALDHFGIVVDDAAEVLRRMQAKHRDANIVERPSTKPFAAFSGHDPDGNIFDLAQRDNDRRLDIYAQQTEEAWHQDRYLNKFAIRTPHAERVAEFYQDVFEFKRLSRNTPAAGYHLTDGRVTLSILPWSIDLFAGMAVKRPGPDHIGFKVEDLTSFKSHMTQMIGANSFLRPIELGGGPEADVRLRLLQSVSLGKIQIADPEGLWLDIDDGKN